ncbi:putative Adenylate cyclase [Blattamonas nauphoetae]|uniref:Adenylate cyclase n=1 Tax=Blattamonas nauphoetae TaxID=2049346 RepID=A0ABQ9XL64_9EUKA|nr:putative Adenylate cyclase [Blattamonas nauphoetae]
MERSASFEGRDTVRTIGILVYRSDQDQEISYQLRDTRTVIGRSKRCTVKIDVNTISKFHAVIYRHGHKCYIKDCNSSNGTTVNTKPVEVYEVVGPDGRFVQNGKKQSKHSRNKMDPDDKASPGERLTSGDRIALGSCFLTFKTKTEHVSSSSEDPGSKGLPNVRGGVDIKETDLDFKPSNEINDLEILKRDYERLRVTYMFHRSGIDSDLEKMAKKAIDVIFKLLPKAESAAIFLTPEGVDELQAVAFSRNKQSSLGDSSEVPIDKKLIDYARKRKQAVLSDDTRSDEKFNSSISLHTQSHDSALAVPLIGSSSGSTQSTNKSTEFASQQSLNELDSKRNEHGAENGLSVVGALFLASSNQDAFNHKDLSLVSTLAAPIGKAISSQQLLQRMLNEERQHQMLGRFLPAKTIEQFAKKNKKEDAKRQAKKKEDDEMEGKETGSQRGLHPSISLSSSTFRNSSFNAEMSIDHDRHFNDKDQLQGLQHVHRESMEVKHATILFAKLKNVDEFVHSVEHKGVTNATLLFSLLNAFFERGVKIVFEHNGILDKFIDECMMATWGGNILAGDEDSSDESEEEDELSGNLTKSAEKETTDGRENLAKFKVKKTKDQIEQERIEREIRREQRIIQKSPALTTIQAVRAALDVRLAINKWNQERKAHYEKEAEDFQRRKAEADKQRQEYRRRVKEYQAKPKDAPDRGPKPKAPPEPIPAHDISNYSTQNIYMCLPPTPLSVSIGLNTGRTIAGFLGARQRLEWTMVGDDVNLASRLSSLAKTDEIVISESTKQMIDEAEQIRKDKEAAEGKTEFEPEFIVIELAPQRVKGFTDPVRTFVVDYYRDWMNQKKMNEELGLQDGLQDGQQTVPFDTITTLPMQSEEQGRADEEKKSETKIDSTKSSERLSIPSDKSSSKKEDSEKTPKESKPQPTTLEELESRLEADETVAHNDSSHAAPTPSDDNTHRDTESPDPRTRRPDLRRFAIPEDLTFKVKKKKKRSTKERDGKGKDGSKDGGKD